MIFTSYVVAKGQLPPWLIKLPELSDPNEPINFFLVLKQNQTGMQKLETIFWKITNPDSNEYQNWLTSLNAVKLWLREESFTSVKLIATDVFQISTTVGQLSKCFSAEFHPFKNSKTSKTIHRTLKEICLPEEISQYIDFWVGVNDILSNPQTSIDQSKQRIVMTKNAAPANPAPADAPPHTPSSPLTVPQLVLSLYNITNVSKNGLPSDVSQGSIQFNNQFYREQDLQTYSTQAGIPFKPLTQNHIIGNNDPLSAGTEAMLDVEQMFGINPLAETWYINSGTTNLIVADFFLYSLTLNEMNDLPQILSMSYVSPEAGSCTFVTKCNEEAVSLTKRYISRTNIEFMKLTMRGITVLVSSGDSGANNYFSDCTNKVFYPDYPASSPFVTSVGATSLVNLKYKVFQDQPPICTNTSPFYPSFPCVSAGAEIAVSFDDDTFVGFSSGGGFSNVAPQPYYQKDAVNHYFRNKQYYNNKNSEYFPPSSMYNRSGRAYPDVAALGVNAFLVVDTLYTLLGGTSMSSPLWAGIVSILNSHSIKITGKTLGFLNPLLYKMAKECPDCFHDITVGNNKCPNAGCTDQCKGFQAAYGWDPVTGLGSPQFGNMLQYITKLLKKKINKTEYK